MPVIWGSPLLGRRGGLVYDVSAYGAVGDGVTDDAPAFQRALDAAAANGGGVVRASERPEGSDYFLAQRITIAGTNVFIEGPFKGQGNAGGVRVKVGHTNWPAIVLDGSSEAGDYPYLGVRNLSFAYANSSGVVQLAAPTNQTTWEGTTDCGAWIGIDRCSRVRIENLFIPYCHDAVQCGTTNNPIGAGRLEVHGGNEWWFHRTGLRVPGASYLEVRGGQWQCWNAQVGTGVKFDGLAATDGALISGLFLETCGIGVKIGSSVASMASIQINDCLFDSLGIAGVHIAGAGAVVAPDHVEIRKIDIIGNRFTGILTHPGVGVLIEQAGSAVVWNITVAGGNRVNEMGSHGIWVPTPAVSGNVKDVSINGNYINNCSFKENEDKNGITLGNNLLGMQVNGNDISSRAMSAGRKMIYGISGGTGMTVSKIANNTTLGMGTAATLEGTADNGTTIRWVNNV